MRPQIDHRTTGRLLRIKKVRRQPALRILFCPESTIMGDVRPDLYQFTKQLSVKDIFDGEGIASIESGQRDHQYDSSLAYCRHDLVTLMESGSQHFFGKDVLASLGSRNHHVAMHGRWGINDDAIYSSMCQQVIQAVIEGNAQSLRLCMSTRWCFVPNGCDCCSRIAESLM